MRHHDVASMLIRHCFDVMCLLGRISIYFLLTRVLTPPVFILRVNHRHAEYFHVLHSSPIFILFIYSIRVENRVDSDQMASSEAD